MPFQPLYSSVGQLLTLSCQQPTSCRARYQHLGSLDSTPEFHTSGPVTFATDCRLLALVSSGPSGSRFVVPPRLPPPPSATATTMPRYRATSPDPPRPVQ